MLKTVGTMKSLLGKPVAESIQNEVKERALRFTQKNGYPPKLVVVLVGEDPASVIYTRKKGEMALSLGLAHETLCLPTTISPEKMKGLVSQLNQDPKVHGILIQRPLPKAIKEEEVLFWISPEKDVDAFHPLNAGKLFLGLPGLQPCTPAGIMELLKYYKIYPAGKLACIIGRSSIVGKPMASLLLKANATVIQCHSQTSDLKSITRQADLLVVAAGRPGLVDASYVKKRAVVIDVGIHRNSNGKISGDVIHDEVAAVASAITPVPGGIGPMTIALLMKNTLAAAESLSSS